MKALVVLFLCLTLSQGETLPNREGRIVGGTVIEIADAPYQVALLEQDTPTTYAFFCGGSIISAEWIVSAAHCTTSRNASSIKARVGSNQHAKDGNLHQIALIYNHPEYNKEIAMDYDVALLKVYTPIVLLKNVKEAIKLHSSGSDILAETVVFISGWGLTNATLTTAAPKLRGATVTTKTQLECTWSYCRLAEITDRMVCAASPGIDACSGDSGGPMLRESDGLLIGIVSFGYGCADPNYFGVYTRVAFVRDWIKRKSGI